MTTPVAFHVRGERRCSVGVGSDGETIFAQYVRADWADAEIERLKLCLSDGDADAIDAGRWYFLTRYVDSLTRDSAGWICHYRRQPNGPVFETTGATILAAVKGAMDDVARFETMGAIEVAK